MPTNKSTTADMHINSEGVLYVMLAVDLTITAVSRLFISVFGNDIDSFTGKSLTQFTFFDDHEKWISSIRYCLSNPGVAVHVEVDTTPGESVKAKHFQWSILSLADAGNNQNGIFCLGKEITEDKKNKIDLSLKKGLPEHVLQAYIHSTHEGLFIFDQNYCVTFANQAAIIISTGVTNKIVHTGDDIVTIIPEGRKKKVLQILEHVFRGETIEYEVCYNYINDRKPRWLFVTVSPIYNKNGKIDFVSVSLRDITISKIAEQQLKKTEQILNTYVQTSHEGFYLFDRNYQVLLVNKAASIILKNVIKDELHVGMNMLEQAPAHRKKEIIQLFERVFLGETIEYEIKYEFQEGLPCKWLAHSITPVFDSSGNVLYACSNSRDITVRKQSEEQIQLNEERLRLALYSIGDNVWEYNFITGKAWYSSGISLMLGYSTEEISLDSNNRYWLNSVHPDDLKRIMENDERYQSGEITQHSLEYRIRYRDGSYKWVLDKGVVIEQTTDGKPIRIVGTHTDITKEKQLQEQLNEKEKQKQKEIVAAVIAAQEKDRQTIAYELHENVSQLLSMSKMMLGVYPSKDPMSADYSNQANEIIGKAINEMRRISDSIDPSNVKIVGLPNAVEDLANGIRKSQDLQIQINISKYNKNVAHNPDVELAVFRIIQEWLNTVIRQGKATVAVIELAGKGPQILLTIRDNGVGIDLASILEGPDTRNIFNRSELYDGKLNIYNESGTGCTLKLIIPAK